VQVINLIVVQRVENRMKGGVPSVDGLQSGQGASHRNLRGDLADGWEMMNEQIGLHKENQARTVFHMIETMFRYCKHVVPSSYGQPRRMMVNSLMVQCKMVLSNHFDSSVLVTLIFGLRAWCSQSLAEPDGATSGPLRPNSQALRRCFRRILPRPSG
jgi:hypothetical protein